MRTPLKLLSLLLALIITMSGVGVFATWQYAGTDFSEVNTHFESLQISMTPWTDFPEEQLTVTEHFKRILNSEIILDEPVTINGIKYTDSFEALIAAFENSSKQSSVTLHNDSYIGSMQTTGEDAAGLTALFGDALEKEQGKNEYYDIMLKRENLDSGNATGMGYYMNGDHNWNEENKYYMGTEMVLFTTDEDIPNYNPYRTQYVTVYATVFSRKPKYDANGNPIQKTFTDSNGGSCPVYHYVYNYGSFNGYEVEVYLKNGVYYSVSDSSYVAGANATVYPLYDYSGSSWTEIGYYTGRAQVTNYSSASKVPSFDTGTWRNTENYGHGTNLTLSQCVYYTLNP